MSIKRIVFHAVLFVVSTGVFLQQMAIRSKARDTRNKEQVIRISASMFEFKPTEITLRKGLPVILELPHLASTRVSYTDGEMFWIVKHGIRNTAMLAWGNLLSDEDSDGWSRCHLAHIPLLRGGGAEPIKKKKRYL